MKFLSKSLALLAYSAHISLSSCSPTSHPASSVQVERGTSEDKKPIHHHEGKPHCDWMISTFRWKTHAYIQPWEGGPDDDCKDVKKWGKHSEKTLKEGGRCHSWDRGFQLFSYAWVWHLNYNEDYECYGNCTILFYSGEDCGGVEVKQIENANTDELSGECYRTEKDDPMIRSARLVCDRN